MTDAEFRAVTVRFVTIAAKAADEMRAAGANPEAMAIAIGGFLGAFVHAHLAAGREMDFVGRVVEIAALFLRDHGHVGCEVAVGILEPGPADGERVH